MQGRNHVTLFRLSLFLGLTATAPLAQSSEFWTCAFAKECEIGDGTCRILLEEASLNLQIEGRLLYLMTGVGAIELVEQDGQIGSRTFTGKLGEPLFGVFTLRNDGFLMWTTHDATGPSTAKTIFGFCEKS